MSPSTLESPAPETLPSLGYHSSGDILDEPQPVAKPEPEPQDDRTKIVNHVQAMLAREEILSLKIDGLDFISSAEDCRQRLHAMTDEQVLGIKNIISR